MEKSIKIIYDELKKFTINEQLDLLRDCGFAHMVDRYRIKPDDETFKMRLKKIISKIKEEYGNDIKEGTWSGIRERILSELNNS